MLEFQVFKIVKIWTQNSSNGSKAVFIFTLRRLGVYHALTVIRQKDKPCFGQLFIKSIGSHFLSILGLPIHPDSPLHILIRVCIPVTQSHLDHLDHSAHALTWGQGGLSLHGICCVSGPRHGMPGGLLQNLLRSRIPVKVEEFETRLRHIYSTTKETHQSLLGPIMEIRIKKCKNIYTIFCSIQFCIILLNYVTVLLKSVHAVCHCLDKGSFSKNDKFFTKE